MQVQPKKVYYRGKALVVGNDHYDQVKPDLDNAVNDAKGIYEAFKERFGLYDDARSIQYRHG